MRAANACGPMKSGTAPWVASFVRASAVPANASRSPAMRATRPGGVPAGAMTPNHRPESGTGRPSSAMVGTSGNSGARFGPSTASGRTSPAWRGPTKPAMPCDSSGTRPPATSCIKGAVPR